MNKNYSIEGIFATPIYRAKIDNIPLNFQQMTQKFINEGMVKNYGNYVSKDTYVLNQPDAKEVKDFCQHHLENFYKTVNKKLRDLREYVEKNAEYVGDNFVSEARSIHYDKKNVRSIYGKASTEQTEELLEEGIEVNTVPWIEKPNS